MEKLSKEKVTRKGSKTIGKIDTNECISSTSKSKLDQEGGKSNIKELELGNSRAAKYAKIEPTDSH